MFHASIVLGTRTFLVCHCNHNTTWVFYRVLSKECRDRIYDASYHDLDVRYTCVRIHVRISRKCYISHYYFKENKVLIRKKCGTLMNLTSLLHPRANFRKQLDLTYCLFGVLHLHVRSAVPRGLFFFKAATLISGRNAITKS